MPYVIVAPQFRALRQQAQTERTRAVAAGIKETGAIISDAITQWRAHLAEKDKGELALYKSVLDMYGPAQVGDVFMQQFEGITKKVYGIPKDRQVFPRDPTTNKILQPPEELGKSVDRMIQQDPNLLQGAITSKIEGMGPRQLAFKEREADLSSQRLALDTFYKQNKLELDRIRANAALARAGKGSEPSALYSVPKKEAPYFAIMNYEEATEGGSVPLPPRARPLTNAQAQKELYKEEVVRRKEATAADVVFKNLKIREKREDLEDWTYRHGKPLIDLYTKAAKDSPRSLHAKMLLKDIEEGYAKSKGMTVAQMRKEFPGFLGSLMNLFSSSDWQATKQEFDASYEKEGVPSTPQVIQKGKEIYPGFRLVE